MTELNPMGNIKCGSLDYYSWVFIPFYKELHTRAPCHILLNACHKSRQNIYSHPIHLRLGHANGFEQLI